MKTHTIKIFSCVDCPMVVSTGIDVYGKNHFKCEHPTAIEKQDNGLLRYVDADIGIGMFPGWCPLGDVTT